jgi:hypothetical protein
LGYTDAGMNAAIARVEKAKQNNPIGWGMLDEIGLEPSDPLVTYAFQNAKVHEARLVQQTDPCIIYATGWLQGLAIGYSLEKK